MTNKTSLTPFQKTMRGLQLGKKEPGKIKTPKIYLNKQTVPRSNTPEELACNQRTSHKGWFDRNYCRHPLWQMSALWKKITEKRRFWPHRQQQNTTSSELRTDSSMLQLSSTSKIVFFATESIYPYVYFSS